MSWRLAQGFLFAGPCQPGIAAKADVAWYQKHLAEDFLSTESDGSRLNKEELLRLTEKEPDVLDYRLEQVDVRILGNAALVHATGLFTRKNHTKGRKAVTPMFTSAQNRNGKLSPPR